MKTHYNKIGIFDSGIGGLTILNQLITNLPQYDYIYLGDTARAPYGDRTQQTIYEYTEQAVRFLFAQNCNLIILACNTASAEALRELQTNYLPPHFPDRKILGVIVPTAESITIQHNPHKIGILATQSTVDSNAYPNEISKLYPSAQVWQVASPLLVPLIEADQADSEACNKILGEYLQPLMNQSIDSLILGCTHYETLLPHIKKIVGSNVNIISQPQIIAAKLEHYLHRHPELSLTTHHTRQIFCTDMTPAFSNATKRLFPNLKPQLAKI